MRRALLAAAILVGIAGRARAGDGVDLLRFMPEDTQVFASIDVAAVRDAPLAKNFHDWLDGIAPGKFSGDLSRYDSAAVGYDEHGHFVSIFEGKGPDKPLETLGKEHAYTATTYHQVTYWTSSTGKTAIAVVDRRVIVTRGISMEAAIDVALGKLPSAAKSAKASALRELIAGTDTRHDLWAAGTLGSLAVKLHAKGIDVTGFSLGAGVSDILTIDLKVVTADEASATALAKLLDAGGPVVAGLQKLGMADAVKSYDSDHDGTVVHASATVSKADLEAFGNTLFSHAHHRHP